MTQGELDFDVPQGELDYAAQDEATRAKIREALDDTLFVEAGAGTGKTRALVDRVVALVLAGRPIERIIAITFTEKAAAELRDRVRSGLEETLSERPERPQPIQAALDALDRAQISTIHAFARNMLRFFAAEAGIDPDFVVLDELQAARRRQDRWRTYLEGLAADEAATGTIDRVLALGLTTREIETLASELTSRAELAERLEEVRPDSGRGRPDFTAMMRSLEALPIDDAPEGSRLRVRCEELLGLVRRMAREGADWESLLASGAGLLEHSYNVGAQKDWGGKDAVETAREKAKDVCEQLKTSLKGARAEALARLLPLVVRFVGQERVARGRDGELTFDDLVLGLRDLLKNSPAAVEAFRERYDALLVDEFQDTDPLQVDIALSFATDPRTGRLEAGRLFLVGDPKQSIYRFRRADMAVYARTRDLVKEQGGGFPALSLNRRSRDVVLDWVNAVFPSLIGEGDDPQVQPPYRPIYPARPESVRGPGAGWFGGEQEGARAREIRGREARALAAQCRAALEEGWQVCERDGAVRDAAYRDIAILIPTRQVLAPLERALADAGIPYRVEGGSLIYRTQEVRDLINCLTAIDDPADEVAIVGALRSIAFACSDGQIAGYRAKGGRFNYLTRGLEDQEGPVAEALRTLKTFHERRHAGSLAALVERFVADRGLVDIGILDQADRNSFRRMRFMVEQARAFEQHGPESLRAFVVWMERRATEAMLDQEGAGLDDDEDAVRVLTIHGAKGLEFPVVFLAGLGAAPRTTPPTYGFDHATSRVTVSIGAKGRNARFELGPVEDAARLEGLHAEAEANRLLYVAATRARDHLLISLYHSSRASQCAARRLIEHGAREPAGGRPELPAVNEPRSEPFADLEVELPKSVSVEQFREEREILLKAARKEAYTSATALGREKKEEATDEGEPWSRGRGGTRVGRAVHAAIQSVPLDADESTVDAFARAQAVAEAVPERSSEVARLVRKALASDAAGRARAATRALREVPFAVSFDGTVLEGFVDLVIETPEGIEIVDWKTDDVPADAVSERLQEYELQAGLYVLGLEEATGKQVSRVTYVFARAGVEASPGEPWALRELARSRVQEAPDRSTPAGG